MSMDSKERIAKAIGVASDTKAFELGHNIICEVPELFNRFFKGRKAVVVAGAVTWQVAGEQVFMAMKSAGIDVSEYIIKTDGFRAEWRFVDAIDKLLDGSPEECERIENQEDYIESEPAEAMRPQSEDYPIAVAVGVGTINDICKLCSYHHNQSYISVVTAASVDGFSSFGASIIYNGAKTTFDCPAPVAILADLDIIADAPVSITAGGYADLAAKVIAGGEWIIADAIGVEPIIPEAWDLLQNIIDELLANPEGIPKRDPKAISDLVEGLMISGFAMQAARSSRPASGSEHLFSHYLDMVGHRYKGRLQSHGFQVAIGTLAMCAIFDELLKCDLSALDVDACVSAWPTLEEEQARASRLLADFPSICEDAVTMKYTDADAVRAELGAIKAGWPELKEKIRAKVYTFGRMRSMLKAAGAPYEPSMIGLTREQVYDMLPYVQIMRGRFNLLDFARQAGLYDRLVEAVFRNGGVWDIAHDLETD